MIILIPQRHSLRSGEFGTLWDCSWETGPVPEPRLHPQQLSLGPVVLTLRGRVKHPSERGSPLLNATAANHVGPAPFSA